MTTMGGAALLGQLARGGEAVDWGCRRRTGEIRRVLAGQLDRFAAVVGRGERLMPERLQAGGQADRDAGSSSAIRMASSST